MSELYLVCWLARPIDGYAEAAGHGVPEFYLEPIAIPVGAGMCRLGAGRRPARGPLRRPGLAADGAVSHAIPADGHLPRRPLPRRPRPRRHRGDAVLPGPAAGGARLHGRGRALAQAGQRHRPRRRCGSPGWSASTGASPAWSSTTSATGCTSSTWAGTRCGPGNSATGRSTGRSSRSWWPATRSPA